MTSALNDPFDDIVAGLSLAEPGDDVLRPDLMDSLELKTHYDRVRRELKELGEMYADLAETGQASTPRGRELHSERLALLTELRRRGLSD